MERHKERDSDGMFVMRWDFLLVFSNTNPRNPKIQKKGKMV